MFRYALLAAAFAAFAAPAAADDVKTPVRAISVQGHGEARARPDLAVVLIGVMRGAETARAALDENNKAMAAILAALTAAGIDARDVQTSNFSVNPRYNYGASGNEPPKVVGYDVVNTVTVTVRKLESLGAVLDQAVSSGSNQINGVMFSIADPAAAMDAARKAAVADAKRKAALFAGEAGLELGKPISISEGGAYQPPVPVTMARADKSEAGAVPVSEGEQVLAADVTVTFEAK